MNSAAALVVFALLGVSPTPGTAPGSEAVVANDDTAILTAINTARSSDSTIRYRRTTVWVRRGNRWRCVSFHGSRILE